jgi:hypothetical protein
MPSALRRTPRRTVRVEDDDERLVVGLLRHEVVGGPAEDLARPAADRAAHLRASMCADGSIHRRIGVY